MLSVAVPPFEVTYVTVDGGGLVKMDGLEATNDELETEMVTPDSVKTGDEVPGVSTTTVDPDGVVTVVKLGLGMLMVAMPPFEVSTWTEVSQVGMLKVAVPPSRVSTWETTGTLTAGMVEVLPPGVTMVTEPEAG
jgi:hypothetical protein